MGIISPLIPIFLSILRPLAMSTPGIEDTVKSTLTCVGVEQKSYECLLDYDVEGYLCNRLSQVRTCLQGGRDAVHAFLA